MLKIPGNELDSMVEFCLRPGGCIQIREVLPGLQHSPAPWRDLTRMEMIFYLDCGGIVGVWLDDLRRQGLIRTRQKRRSRFATTQPSPENTQIVQF